MVIKKFNRLESAQKLCASRDWCHMHAHQFWWAWNFLFRALCTFLSFLLYYIYYTLIRLNDSAFDTASEWYFYTHTSIQSSYLFLLKLPFNWTIICHLILTSQKITIPLLVINERCFTYTHTYFILI